MKSFKMPFLLVLALGCSSGSDPKYTPKQWPPDSQQRSSVTGFQPSTNLSFDGWDLIYVSKEDKTNVRGQTALIKEGNFELPYNLFAIDTLETFYTESQFEVLYYDDQKTQIRAVEEQGDRIAFITKSSITNSGRFIFAHSGARVRYAGQLYELHAEGWYHNGTLVHTFSNEAFSERQ